MKDAAGHHIAIKPITVDGIIYRLQQHGGITVYANELLRRMARDNVDFGVLAYGGNVPSEVQRVTSSLQMRKLERYRSLRSDAPTVFHSTYYRIGTGKRVRNVTTVHDFTYERYVSGPRKWIHSTQKFAAIRAADAVICISENTRQDLLKFLPEVNEDRIVVVPNGVSESYFPQPEHTALHAYPFVLFVGARGGYKNFEAAAHAVSRLPDVHLIAVGGGAFSPGEKRLLDDILPSRYKHSGLVTDESLNNLYNEALCLMYPSAYEGFGIPVLEAMRAGCPVIALRASSIPEVAGNAGILLEDADAERMADAITRASTPTHRAELREMGFKQVLKFSWEYTYDRTRAVYRSLLS